MTSERSAGSPGPDTHFAPAGRVDAAELQRQIEVVSNNPVIDGLMASVGGLLAVLNEQRQILAVNESLLRMFGIQDPDKSLGLRPGEFVSCVHAHDGADGCGTGEYCATCGAAIAIVASLAANRAEERKCVAAVTRGGVASDLFLNVRASPITFNERRFVLLFMQDVSDNQRWAALERAFFHDVNNIIHGLVGTSELLTMESTASKDELARQIREMSLRLAREVAIQKALFDSGPHEYPLSEEEVPIAALFEDLKLLFANHSAAKGRHLRLPDGVPNRVITSDASLLLRILGNMLANAFEASKVDDEVRLWMEAGENEVCFKVWNKGAIPESVARRIFQRNFSTKTETGRGLGTYAMKLFGEDILKGKVGFSSSESDGTIFHLTLKV